MKNSRGIEDHIHFTGRTDNYVHFAGSQTINNNPYTVKIMFA